MNALIQAQKAYSPAHVSLIPGKSTEAKIFAQVTSRLKKSAKYRDVNYPSFVSALAENQSMWTTIAVDLANDHNLLPDSLRAQLISLSIFMTKQTDKVLNHDANIDLIIDINTSILRGLSQCEVS